MTNQIGIFNQQIKELLGTYREAMMRKKISENEFWVWYALGVTEDVCTQQDICNEWSLTKQTVNTVILSMVEKGYATLEAMPGARNRKRIQLTEKGKEYAKAMIAPIFEAEQRAFDRITKEEKTVCIAALGEYIHYLKAELNDEGREQKG